MFMLTWNKVVLTPDVPDYRRLRITPSLRLPGPWQFGTALRVAAQTGADLRFAPVSEEILIDSPFAAGLNVRKVPFGRSLAERDPQAQLDAALRGAQQGAGVHLLVVEGDVYRDVLVPITTARAFRISSGSQTARTSSRMSRLRAERRASAGRLRGKGQHVGIGLHTLTSCCRPESRLCRFRRFRPPR
jgi:hypothetical protein